MPGWRMGFAAGNQTLIAALTRMKSYLDYGAFTPIQVAATAALNGPQDCVAEIRDLYRERRDVLIKGLHAGRLGRALPGRLDVRLGADPAALRRTWAASNSPSCCWREAKVAVAPGHRLRRTRRRPRAHRPGRERPPPAPGGAQHPRTSCNADATVAATDAGSTKQAGNDAAAVQSASPAWAPSAAAC